ncbi:MAG: hypothetical protein JST00_30755 [Deltaproteobacteria bacterium]|nr:hypothetical protein [Deltaproteobacteria bacterium]
MREWLRQPGAWVRGLVVLTFLASFGFVAFARIDPTGTLRGGGHTDHVAHMGETRAMLVSPGGLWRQSPNELFRRLPAERVAALPEDIRAFLRAYPPENYDAPRAYDVPGFPPDRPLVLTWSETPKLYPPGVFVIAAPSAILHHLGIVSFGTANRIFLAILLLAWSLMARSWLDEWTVASPPSRGREIATSVVLAFTWYWAMEGMYDVVAVCFATWALRATRKERYGTACLLWGASFMVHSRLLTLAPLFVLAMVRGLRAWTTTTRSERARFVAGAGLVGSSLGFAAYIQPSLARVVAVRPSPPNVVHPTSTHAFVLVTYVLFVLILAAVLRWERLRWDAVVVVFAAMAFSLQRCVAAWYFLPIVAWVMSPPGDRPATGADSPPAPPWGLAGAASRWALLIVFYGLSVTVSDP